MKNQSHSLKNIPLELVVLLVAVAAVALPFVEHDQLSAFGNDAVSYLLMARCWSPHETPTAMEVAGCAMENYPPLFPTILALTGAADDFLLAHRLVVFFFLGALVATWLLARRLLINRSAVFLTVGLMVMAPLLWTRIQEILSESVYLLISLAVLVFFEARFKERHPSVRELFWLGVGVTALMMTRTLGLAMAAALVTVTLLDPARRSAQPGRLLAPAVLALVVSGLWSLANPPGGEVKYGQSLELVAGGDLLALAVNQAVNLADSWIYAFALYWQPGGARFWLIIVFGLFALLGLLWRLRHWTLDGWYVFFYLGIILAWPFPGQMPRFLFGVFPLLVIYGVYGMVVLAGFFQGRGGNRWLPLLLPLLMLAVSAPSARFFALRAAQETPVTGMDFTAHVGFFRQMDLKRAEADAFTHGALLQDMERIRQSTPPEARVMWFMPSFLPLLAGRHGVILPPLEPKEQFLQAVWQSGADHAFVSRFHPRDTREGVDGMRWLPALLPFSKPVWWRTIPGGQEPMSMLLRIDRQRLQGRTNQ